MSKYKNGLSHETFSAWQQHQKRYSGMPLLHQNLVGSIMAPITCILQCLRPGGGGGGGGGGGVVVGWQVCGSNPGGGS